MVVLRRVLFGLVVPRRALRWGRLTATWRGPPADLGWSADDVAVAVAWHAALQPYRGFL